MASISSNSKLSYRPSLDTIMMSSFCTLNVSQTVSLPLRTSQKQNRIRQLRFVCKLNLKVFLTIFPYTKRPFCEISLSMDKNRVVWDIRS